MEAINGAPLRRLHFAALQVSLTEKVDQLIYLLKDAAAAAAAALARRTWSSSWSMDMPLMREDSLKAPLVESGRGLKSDVTLQLHL